MPDPVSTGYAHVNGVQMYWESRGEGGTPLVVVHGGFGLTSMFGDLLDRLAASRRVIAIELQGHGLTRDIDRPFSYEAFGDDISGLVDELRLGPADLLDYSLGAGACLRAAIQHPDRVRRLALVSMPCRRDGWFPEVLQGMSQVGSAQLDQMKQSEMYRAWAAVAPDPDAFPTLMDKTGALLRRPYDWSDEVRALEMPVQLVYGDADSIPHHTPPSSSRCSGVACRTRAGTARCARTTASPSSPGAPTTASSRRRRWRASSTTSPFSEAPEATPVERQAGGEQDHGEGLGAVRRHDLAADPGAALLEAEEAGGAGERQTADRAQFHEDGGRRHHPKPGAEQR
jgi:pimeloyl-ACP methyl ester carboxylesterase